MVQEQEEEMQPVLVHMVGNAAADADSLSSSKLPRLQGWSCCVARVVVSKARLPKLLHDQL